MNFLLWFLVQLWWNCILHWPLCLPPHFGIGPLHITFPSIRIHVIVSVPWVLINPSSQITEIELPNWKLSPNRLALIGIPGSGHSLCPNAWEQQKKRKTHKLAVWDRPLCIGDEKKWFLKWLCSFLEKPLLKKKRERERLSSDHTFFSLMCNGCGCFKMWTTLYNYKISK